MKKVSGFEKSLILLFIFIFTTTVIPLPFLPITISPVEATVAYHRGVNMAGAEFNSGTLPGSLNSNYTFNNEASYTYFGNKKFDIIRVPVLWERLQPTLNGALDTNYLNGLKSNVTWAKSHNLKVIIDIHNYGRYRGNIVGSTAVTYANFNDLWVKLSNVFKSETGVYAYDLMNEPHGMSTTSLSDSANWRAASQSAVTAIRNNGDNTLIMVEGTYYANAHGWESKNGTSTSWITDPANNFMYSAHCYFDSNASGTYSKVVNKVTYPTTYDEELALNKNLATVGTTRVMDFVNWLNKNNARGFIGEFGAPNDDDRWKAVLDDFMKTLDKYGLDSTYWAAGTWWGTYRLSVQPTNNYATDANLMSVLLNHLSGSASSSNEMQYSPIADAYTRDGSYQNSNYGSQGVLDLKKDTSGNNRRAYLKFDLSAIDKPILSAKLRIYGGNNTDSTATGVTAYETSSDTWAENTITWANSPDISSPISGVNVNNTQQYYDIDVTDFVLNQIAGDKIASMVLDCSTSGKVIEFSSKEAPSNKPMLVVEFDHGPKVTQTIPQEGTVLYNKPYVSPVSIYFNTDMDATTLTNKSNITIQPATTYSLSYDTANKRLNIAFPNGLFNNTQFKITIKGSAVKSAAQEAMAADKILTFTATSNMIDTNGINIVQGVNSAQTNVQVTNNQSIPLNTALVLVLYQNNVKISMTCQQSTIAAGAIGNLQTPVLTVPDGLSDYRYKAFLWKGLDSLDPLILQPVQKP